MPLYVQIEITKEIMDKADKLGETYSEYVNKAVEERNSKLVEAKQ